MTSFSPEEIGVILTSLHYSKQRNSDGRVTPNEIKKESFIYLHMERFLLSFKILNFNFYHS